MRRRTLIVVVSVLVLAGVLAAPASASLGFGQASMRGAGGIESPENAVDPILLPRLGDSFYEIYDAAGISWEDAAALVAAMDFRDCYSHLVTITSQEEQDFLYDFFDGDLQGKWYGGFQDPGEVVPDAGWNWVTGEPWVYTNWAAGEPNDAYGVGTEPHLLGWDDGWAWNDEGNLANVSGYVVEHEGCDLGPTGPATFSFNVRTTMFSPDPVGSLLYRFPAAGLTFSATGFDTLAFFGAIGVVEGTGTFNGMPGYSFVMAAHEDLEEMFYIAITHIGSGELVYTTFNLVPVTAGYIAIHPL